jgi:hypothetical protein
MDGIKLLKRRLERPLVDADIAPKAGIALSKLENRAGTDHSASAAVTGFSGTPTVVARYIKIGKIVFLWFNISGTSNAATLGFNLPAVAKRTESYIGFKVTDNGTVQLDSGLLNMTAGSATVACYKTSQAAVWTGSGAKAIEGILIYESE